MTVAGKLDGVDLSVRAGEIVGVFGLIGSGIETLGRAIYGALGPATGGTIHITGSAYRPELAGRARRAASASSPPTASTRASSAI